MARLFMLVRCLAAVSLCPGVHSFAAWPEATVLTIASPRPSLRHISSSSQRLKPVRRWRGHLGLPRFGLAFALSGLALSRLSLRATKQAQVPCRRFRSASAPARSFWGGISRIARRASESPEQETPAEEKPKSQESGQVVTPWEVEAGEDGVDYGKLIESFGCEAITPEQILRIERLTGKRPHRFLRRGLFFSHRDLNELLDAYEKGEPFYIYTGRGPSSEALHLGHLVPFLFTKWLQEAFDVPLVIELTDDEKFLFKKDLSIEEARRLAWENAKDIIACGFDPAKTFIFRDTDYIRELYPVALQIQKRITLGTAQNTFGFTRSDNIGKVAFAAIQSSPSFALAFPGFLKPGTRCFIPQAIDQDPYFRVCRGVAEKLKWPKPALIHSKFLPALQGAQTKMSASVASTALYMTDTEKKLRKKINKNAFSGGGATVEEQRENGANLEVDVAYQYLKIWLEDDDELAQIGQEYSAGRMLTGEVKKRLGDVVWELVSEHQEARTKVDDAMLERFMDPYRSELQEFAAKAIEAKGE